MTTLPSPRLAGRSARIFARTTVMYAAFEAETAWRPATERDAVLYRWMGRWAHMVLDTLGVRVRAEGPHVGQGRQYPGRDGNGLGRVFILNHRSAIDVPLTLTLAEAHPVSRADLGAWPLVGPLARRVGTMFVDRASRRSGVQVVARMSAGLREGRGVAIYPEGTAFAGDEVRPLHPGAFLASKRTGAEIVPVGVAYADPEVVYGDESFGAHAQRVAELDRIEVAVCAGQPIVFGDRPLDEVRDEARAALQALVDRARRLHG